LTIILVLIGGLIGGTTGMVSALIFGGVMNAAMWWFSDKLVLMMYRAKPLSEDEAPEVYRIVRKLASQAAMPMPKLYVIEDSAMNAFATGRNPEHAVVCATTGLLQRLNRSEIEAVIAHELSHIKNYDMLLMSIVTVLVGLIALLADWMMRMSFWGGGRKKDNENNGQLGAIIAIVAVILAILSPIIAQLIQLAISRRREFLADASGVSMTKNPQGLIKALSKINQDQEPLEVANTATAHLYISNPLKNTRGIHAFAKLFNTHPPVSERIQALQEMRAL
jgi:heat shock protein HtpX